jgi:NAD(P)-dependent dehydrogenase (short-subunit alcohol dehydrogenase family)
MPSAIITGSGGLIGSEAVARFARAGFDVVGVENDMRARFFGPEASTARTTQRLLEEYPTFRSVELDIRDREGIDGLFAKHTGDLELIVHAAAQPSHDWAASDPTRISPSTLALREIDNPVRFCDKGLGATVLPWSGAAAPVPPGFMWIGIQLSEDGLATCA